MTIQGTLYYLTASLAVFAENRIIHSERVQRIKEKRKAVMRRLDEKVRFEER